MEIKNLTSEKDKVAIMLDDLTLLESYARDLFSFLPLPICMVSPTGIILETNPSIEKISGYGTEELVGETLKKLLSNSDVEQITKTTIEKGSLSSLEVIFKTKDTNQIYVGVSTLLRKNQQGEIIGFFISFFDLTSFKESEGKLQKSQKALLNMLEDVNEEKKKAETEKEKTMALVSSFSTPIIFLNNYHKLALFNSSAKEILNISDNDLGIEILDSNNFSLNNFANIIHNKFSVEKLIEESDGTKLEEAIVTYNNEERVYKVVTSKVLDKNLNYLGLMKIFYDTTREKAIDKMKSEFISIAAHQLRTPLSAIKWIIKMILDGDMGKLNAEQQELLNKGYQSNERIILLVNDLLNVSRIEEGRFGFNFEKTDFQEILNVAVSNVDSLVTQNHQELNVEIPTGLPKISLDKERMVMVMQNLLSNAIKYTPEYGKIQIIIEIDKQYLNVKIKDQGVGIPKEDQPKMFSKFFRASNAIKMKTEGSGLGLFLVKNIIEKHNGTISLKSEEGKGTEVSFTLPINKT
ncbi:MAG: ATP-binding protein [Candidatus Paceibacterota bacterium]